MRTLTEVLNHIAFHPSTPETAEKYDKIRKSFMTLVTDIWPLLPDGPDKTTAMRRIVEAMRECNAVIAVNETPADLDTAHIARVLPRGDVALEPQPEVTCACGGSIVPEGFLTSRAIGSDIIHRRPGDGDCA